jgi:hypothetical protein
MAAWCGEALVLSLDHAGIAIADWVGGNNQQRPHAAPRHETIARLPAP